MTPELLAPAGSPQALLAAIRCGADAVYLGGGAFNARAGARNFSRDALEEAGRLCKSHNVKLYFTLNTLLSGRELPQALALAQEVIRAGADAVIVQDLGLLRLLHEAFPDLPLHASTQCSVQTAAGMALLKELGAARCIVPRELTRGELTALAASAPLELEAFVHGALCMSVSGQCLLSFALGGRSGNKGTCAQPCRLPFSVDSGQLTVDSCGLSLKDLSLLEEVNRPPLSQMAALKIEGRLKRPEYVAAAVTAFRHALDGTASPVSGDELRQTFSRSGFTQGYYQAARDKSMYGARQKEDIAPQETLRRMAALYAKEVPRVPIVFYFCGVVGEPASLTAKALGHSVCVQGETLEPAQTQALTQASVRRQLERLGGTQFYAREVRVDLQDGAFIPMGQLNALRRQALAALENEICRGGILATRAQKKLATRTQKKLATRAPVEIHAGGNYFCAVTARKSAAPTAWFVGETLRFLSHMQIPYNIPEHAQIFLPCDTPPEILSRHRAQITIPAGVFGDCDKILAQLRRAKESGASLAMAQTLDGVALAKEAGLLPIAGEGMNILNSASLEALRDLGCAGALASAEITPAQIRDLHAPIPIGAMVYGRLALMLCRNCPVKAQISCKACANSKSLVDRKGVAFPVRCENSCAHIYNSRPLWLADAQEQLPPLDFRLYSFTTETRGECAAVLRAYQNSEARKGEFTRGWLK